ncbi:hypothetical protein BKI52_22665 [marine bacterium AO1-C]|nr:hypothetical protein BKI52_22665 [marine bacterium AO1-C]
MAISKKRTREIVINGEVFLWKIRKKPTYCQEMGWTNMLIAVQHLDYEQGRSLIINLPYARPGNIDGHETIQVTPALVRSYIQDAIACGWAYNEPGVPYEHQVR